MQSTLDTRKETTTQTNIRDPHPKCYPDLNLPSFEDCLLIGIVVQFLSSTIYVHTHDSATSAASSWPVMHDVYTVEYSNHFHASRRPTNETLMTS